MLLNAIINGLGIIFFIYCAVCVVIGVVYSTLYLFWSVYQIIKGDGEKAMQLDHKDIEAFFFVILRASVVKSRRLHRKFRRFLETRRQKKLKKAIRRLSH